MYCLFQYLILCAKHNLLINLIKFFFITLSCFYLLNIINSYNSFKLLCLKVLLNLI